MAVQTWRVSQLQIQQTGTTARAVLADMEPHGTASEGRTKPRRARKTDDRDVLLAAPGQR